MGGVLDKLKQKGPAGLPIGAWAGIAAIGLYLAYRWYANRAGSTNAGAAPTTAAGGSGATPTAINVTVKNPKPPKKKKPKKKVKHPKHPRVKKHPRHLKGAPAGVHGPTAAQGTPATNTRAISTGAFSTPQVASKRRLTRALPNGPTSVGITNNSVAPVTKEGLSPKVLPAETEHEGTYHPSAPPQKSGRKAVAGGFRR